MSLIQKISLALSVLLLVFALHMTYRTLMHHQPDIRLGEIGISDPYIRSSGSAAKAAAAFMVIRNYANTDDRLIGVSSAISVMTELHTHVQIADGVMQMRPIEDGLPVPAKGKAVMERGGNHIMFMGLKAPLEMDKAYILTLTFEQAGDITIPVPVKSDADRH